jgi:hypothetical protein
MPNSIQMTVTVNSVKDFYESKGSIVQEKLKELDKEIDNTCNT